MKLYIKFLKIILSKSLAYRLDFIFTFISVILWSFAAPLFVILLYNQGGVYPDWTFENILIFMGCFSIVYGIVRTCIYNLFYIIQDKVRKGNLETVLVKPVDELRYLVYQSFQYEGIGEIITGILLLLTGIFMSDINVNIIMLLIYFLAAILFYSSLIIIMSSLAIKFVKAERLDEIVNHLVGIGENPKNLYPNYIQASLSILFPVFILSYYPASAILGFEVSNSITVIFISVIFFIFSVIFFKSMIRSYSGAGG